MNISIHTGGLLQLSSLVMSVHSSSQSSKPSLASFRYRKQILAGANIEIDKIKQFQLPTDLYDMVEEMLNFSGTVPANTPMVSRPRAFHNRNPRNRALLDRPKDISLGMKVTELQLWRNQ